MANRSDRLLKEIEDDALDSKTSIGDLLRKVIALGGKAGSSEMSDWAVRELKGYGPDDDLPPYRRISAPLQIDAGTMHGFIKGQMISRWDLPDFAQDKITNDLELRQSVAEIEQLARSCPPGEVVKLQPFMSQELVHYMNATQKWSGRIERMYWSIAPTTLDGVVDQVRTTLTTLVAEINATMPEGMTVPPAEVANNAFNLAVTGKRNKISVATQQSGNTVTTAAPEEPRKWLRTAAAILVGLAAIVGVFFAIMEVQNWSF